MTNTKIADADGVGRKDVYTKVTERIISDLEQGIRPWMKPWSAKHAAGRVTKLLRHNGTPYRGNKHPSAMGRGDGEGIRRAHLDDL
jgi:antirestriction protein ArdC